MILLVQPMMGTLGDGVYYPSGLLSLFASIKEKGDDVDLLDLEYLTKSEIINIKSNTIFSDIVERILSYEADIVGFSTLAVNYHLVIESAQRLKLASPKTRIILGGPQASATARQTLHAFNQCIDVIVIGEGERTIVNLLDTNFTTAELGSIPGIAFWNGNNVVQTEPVPLVHDLDQLPFAHISREMIDSYTALCAKECTYPFDYNIEIGRGCPYRCSFCATSPMWRRIDRKKTPTRMLDEMNRAAEYGLKAFSLIHDNFTANKRYVREFCKTMIEHGTPYKWTISSRGDAISHEDIQLLKRAGCCGIFIGMETGSEHMQKVFRKNLDLERSCSNIEFINDLGVNVYSNFILGHPQETEEDANQSIKLAMKLSIMEKTNIDLRKLCPLNGSLDYEEYKDKLYYTGNTSDMACRPLCYESTEKLIADHPEIFAAFYSFPCQYMSDDELFIMIELYEVVLRRYPKLALEIFAKEDSTPIELFRKWNRWRSLNHAGLVINQDWIHQTFAQFFRTVILKKF